MNINIKYDINDNVYFVVSSNYGNGGFEIQNGIVNEIKIIRNDKNKTFITYEIRTKRSSFYVDEPFLFKNDSDLYKFFKENIRNFIDENRLVSRKKIEEEDLPF